MVKSESVLEETDGAIDEHRDECGIDHQEEIADCFRQELIAIIEKARTQAAGGGMLYTVKYLSAATIAAEIEAGDGYYLREADDWADKSRERGWGRD